MAQYMKNVKLLESVNPNTSLREAAETAISTRNSCGVDAILSHRSVLLPIDADSTVDSVMRDFFNKTRMAVTPKEAQLYLADFIRHDGMSIFKVHMYIMACDDEEAMTQVEIWEKEYKKGSDHKWLNWQTFKLTRVYMSFPITLGIEEININGSTTGGN